MSRDQRFPWHALLGQALADALKGLPYNVSTEEERPLRGQRLDLLIIEQRPALQDVQRARSLEERPRGLEDLVAHNLLSSKASGAACDVWALDKLNIHCVTLIGPPLPVPDGTTDPWTLIFEPPGH